MCLTRSIHASKSKTLSLIMVLSLFSSCFSTVSKVFAKLEARTLSVSISIVDFFMINSKTYQMISHSKKLIPSKLIYNLQCTSLLRIYIFSLALPQCKFTKSYDRRLKIVNFYGLNSYLTNFISKILKNTENLQV